MPPNLANSLLTVFGFGLLWVVTGTIATILVARRRKKSISKDMAQICIILGPIIPLMWLFDLALKPFVILVVKVSTYAEVPKDGEAR